MSLSQLYHPPRRPFSQNALSLATFVLKTLQHRCFPVTFDLWNFKNTFFYVTPLVTVSAFPVAASVYIFLSKVMKRLLLFCNLVMTSQHIVWCTKSQTRLFINLSSIVRFSIRVYPIKLKLGILDHKNNTFWNTVFRYLSMCL